MMVGRVQAMEICPDSVNFSLVCVNCLIRLTRFEEASLFLDLLLETHHDNPKLLYHRAFCYRALNLPMSAVECLTKVDLFKPTNLHIINSSLIVR